MNFYSEDSGNTTSFRELVCQNTLLNFRLLRVWIHQCLDDTCAAATTFPINDLICVLESENIVF